jgi:carbon starvation protein
LIWTGSIDTIWPMFGIANQLLAGVGLAVGTTILINMGRAKYAWVTLLPLCFVAVTTLTAGYMIVRDRFWPMATGPDSAVHVQGYVNSICTSFMMVLAVMIMVSAARRWLLVLTGKVASRELAAEA